MKVFISHSSTDKWIARRISQDLVDRGIETFLDEKDIKTGQSIDAAIQDHLSDCDELLMLLSPAALKSTWVLIEIGGAKALKKRLIPITNHVPPNELPAVLSGGLARDLNDIDIYYQEVVDRKKSGLALPVEYDVDRAGHSKSSSMAAEWYPQVGDRVQIVPIRPDSSTYAMNVVGWPDEMDNFLGTFATVQGVDVETPRAHTSRLDVDGGEFWWASEWLRPAPLTGADPALGELLQSFKRSREEFNGR